MSNDFDMIQHLVPAQSYNLHDIQQALEEDNEFSAPAILLDVVYRLEAAGVTIVELTVTNLDN